MFSTLHFAERHWKVSEVRAVSTHWKMGGSLVGIRQAPRGKRQEARAHKHIQLKRLTKFGEGSWT